MKRKLGNIIGIALCVLLLPAAAVNLTLAVKSYVYPDRVTTFLGYGALIVETGSMRPAFRENDAVIMKERGATPPRKGDVIAYYDAKGIIVTHRVIGWETDESGARLYITKGDNNNTRDKDPVPAARVAGLVVRVLPGGGKVLRAVGQPLVTVLVIAVPIGLAFGSGSLAKALARKKQQKEVMAEADDPPAEQPEE